MKNYYLILIENFIGIAYLILFLIGFLGDNLNFMNIGGIGMLIFMFIMIMEQPKNLSSFLFMCSIGAVVAYFVSVWWLGIYWVSAFFSAGQLFGIIALIKNKKQLIDLVESKKIETDDLLKFALTGKTTDPDKISFIEIMFFVALLVSPYLLSNNLINNSLVDNSNSLEKEINEQVKHMEKSREYSNQGIKIMNLNDSLVVSQNKIDSYKEFLKKAIEEARKVDTVVLNKIKKGYGTIYFEKYLRSKELELEGYENGNASALTKGQILYDEFVDWRIENMMN